MRVPNDILKSVVFLVCEISGRYQFVGTGFLVARKLNPDDDLFGTYLVTAKHVVDGMKQNGIKSFYVRANTHNGGAEAIGCDIDLWTTHPEDPFLDVAVLPWSPQRDHYEVLTIPEAMVATDETIDRHQIGVGDEVFLTGLFVNHIGRERNIPIVRVGTIAAMPDEPVQTEFFGTTVWIDAYLIEARSIGGLSGSPVFVVTSGVRGNALMLGASFFLLGVLHGHWDLPRASTDAATLDGVQKEAINMGIAMVVPATKIFEVLDSPLLAEQRRRALEDYRRKNSLSQPSDVSE